MAYESSNGALLIAGTSSNAGKSIVCAGLCRALARRGLRVAPFKAQNMALNSAVTVDGSEIGRAQAAQAAAAGVEPEVAMNPVLVKPSGEGHGQFVVLGKPYGDVAVRDYPTLNRELFPIVLESLAALRSRFDVVVCEGAGSVAEINLREHDIVNMGLARAANLPVVVVGDIDRGGVFASLLGSVALLEPADQGLIGGFLINKFRGDPELLRSGLERLTALSGRPMFGVLPWRRGLWLDVEDSLGLEGPRDAALTLAPPGGDRIEVAVVRLRWMSNFTDFDALASEPGVTIRFTQSPADVRRADLVVIPGTKATVADLAFLREQQLDEALRERAERGNPVLGVCGGYQMLGQSIVDQVESAAGLVEGLGLLPVTTEFMAEKTVARVKGTAPTFGNVPAAGYEIHHGVVTALGGEAPLHTAHGPEGCRVGAVMGMSWHGLFEQDELRRALLRWVAEVRGLEWTPGRRPFHAVREEHLDRLADLLTENADLDGLLELATEGPSADLPIVSVSRAAQTPLGIPDRFSEPRRLKATAPSIELP